LTQIKIAKLSENYSFSQKHITEGVILSVLVSMNEPQFNVYK